MKLLKSLQSTFFITLEFDDIIFQLIYDNGKILYQFGWFGTTYRKFPFLSNFKAEVEL